MRLTLEEIERVFADRLPEEVSMILYRVCGHSALINRKLRDEVKSRLPALADSGCFITDKLLHQLQEYLPQPEQTECEAGFSKAQELLLREGISAVGDMSLDETMIAGLQGLAQAGKLEIDVLGCFDAHRAPSVESNGPLLVKNSAVSEYLDRPAEISVRHWKRYLDGSLGSRTAWLSQAYEDEPGIGERLMSIEVLIEEARKALESGFFLSFHVIGDAAMDQALEVGDRLFPLMMARLKVEGPGGLLKPMHRLEHAQVIRDPQIDKIRSHGFWTLCVQPHHRVADTEFVINRLGQERFEKIAYRGARLMRAGLSIALGSDAPVDTYDPVEVLRAAGSHPNLAECLTFEEALWYYTTGSRLNQSMEPGRIGPGTRVWLTPPLDL